MGISTQMLRITIMTRLKTMMMAGLIACLMTPAYAQTTDDERPEVPEVFSVQTINFGGLKCWLYAGTSYEYVLKAHAGMVVYVNFEAESGEYRFPIVMPLDANGQVTEGDSSTQWPAEGGGIVLRVQREGDFMLTFGPNAEHGHMGRATVCNAS